MQRTVQTVTWFAFDLCNKQEASTAELLFYQRQNIRYHGTHWFDIPQRYLLPLESV
jgi:hypothetical protein